MSKKVGRHREEYEQFKSELREYHLDKYTSWLENLQEEGYDVSKWEPEEIIDTYIKENHLWNSVGIIKEAIAKGKKKKDSTYLETDMEKRRKNNEKAIADMKKVKDDTVPRWMREDVRQRLEERRKELSIDDQMRISREANAKRKPYKDGDHQRARAAVLRNAAKKAKKDTRTDDEKMTDATGPRPGSRYRGD
tara:strand:- start:2584 stop:3162 length:579 start_codon:yes stop_codon:yes gene_type:complete